MSNIDAKQKKKKDEFIEKQWQDWLDTKPLETALENVPDIDTDNLKDIVTKDLTFVSAMDVKEYTLYQKWCEVQFKYPTQETNPLFEDKPVLLDSEQEKLIKEVKNNIWNPESIEAYLDLEPELIHTDIDNEDQPLYGVLGDDDSNYEEKATILKKQIEGQIETITNKKLPAICNILKTFLSTGKNNSNIGRNLNYIIRDKKTKKYLGVNCLSSDYLDLTPRDNYIGWQRETKTKKMINHTCVGSTIVPTQPLGYNYVGGKLLALLCISDVVEKEWQNQYKDKLVGVTTTSLYGKIKTIPLSQYDRLDHWKKMGWTSGSVSYETERPTRKLIQKWLMKNHTRKYFEWYVAVKPSGQPHKRDHRNRSHAFTYNQLGIEKKLIKSEHARGIYFSELFKNTKEYLREEIQEDKLVRAFDNSIEALTHIWKTKYAKKRIESLLAQGRVSKETLFYDDIIYLNWEETKKKYLFQVGR